MLAEEEYRVNPWGMKPMLSTDAFFDLVLLATGNEGEARRKAKLRRRELIRTGQETG